MTGVHRVPRRRSKRTPGNLERIGIALACAGTLVLAGFLLAFRTSSGAVGVGSGAPRPDAEQREMLASGECALRPDGTLVGQVAGTLAVSRSNPHARLYVQELGRRRIVQVVAAEVRLVPCAEAAERSLSVR